LFINQFKNLAQAKKDAAEKKTEWPLNETDEPLTNRAAELYLYWQKRSQLARSLAVL